MIFETLSVIPDVFESYLDASIMGRARRAGVFDFVSHDLRDWTHDRHRTVDDAPFGGGQGMLMKPAPIFEAVDELSSTGERPHVVFFSPCGRPYDQRCAERLSRERRVLLVCGRYEGMDERVYSLADDVFSLGDYVLTGGELAALVAEQLTLPAHRAQAAVRPAQIRQEPVYGGDFTVDGGRSKQTLGERIFPICRNLMCQLALVKPYRKFARIAYIALERGD